MHELSIALNILDLVEEEARGSHVVVVHVKLGALSGIVKEALVSAYELAREGTSLAQAQLVIEQVPIVAFCPACAVERTLISMQELRCPSCGAATPRVVSGRELEVVA